VWGTLLQGVHVSSWCRATFGNYQFVGEASLFFISMHIIKTKGKRLAQNIYA
jgi:hypothetical protein